MPRLATLGRITTGTNDKRWDFNLNVPHIGNTENYSTQRCVWVILHYDDRINHNAVIKDPTLKEGSHLTNLTIYWCHSIMKYFLFLLFSAVWLMLGDKLLLGYGLGSASKTLGYCMEVAVGKKTSGDHWSVTGIWDIPHAHPPPWPAHPYINQNINQKRLFNINILIPMWWWMWHIHKWTCAFYIVLIYDMQLCSQCSHYRTLIL